MQNSSPMKFDTDSTHQMQHLKVVSTPCSSFNPPKGVEGKAAPDLLFKAFRDYFAEQAQETVVVVALNPDWNVIGFTEIARGKVNSVPLPISSVCQFAILANAVAVVVMHGHNGQGHPMPSLADQKATMDLEDALRACELSLLDHMIVAPRGFFSFRTAGRLRSE